MSEPATQRGTTVPKCPCCPARSPMVPAAQLNQSADPDRLLEWQCTRCAHTGKTAGRKMQLVFRGGFQYVFSYDVSGYPLTIILSSPAIGLFNSHHIGADELAWKAAEWALLRGHIDKAVDLGLTSDDLPTFYWYFYDVQTSGDLTA